MYAQNGQTKIILRDYTTSQILYIFDNIIESKAIAEPKLSPVTGREFELIPFNSTGIGKLAIKPKELSLDVISFLYNSSIIEEPTEIFYDEIIELDENGNGKLKTLENVIQNKIFVYEFSNDHINIGETLILNSDKSFVSTIKNKTVYVSYSVIKTCKKIKWSSKTSQRFFKIEITNLIQSSIKNVNDAIMISTINKAYLENSAEVLNRVLDGSIKEMPLIFNFLEDRNEISFQTLILEGDIIG